MNRFLVQKDKYFAAVDFGAREDISVMIVAKQNNDGTIEIVDSKRLGHSRDWDELKKEEYQKTVEKIT